MNQHVELYKKYRPARWEDLVGQETQAKSLRSAVMHNKLPTAYGFFGDRGCGKTSAAFILAKALNCDNPPNDGNPCNECATCLNIDNGRQLGINYISMANNGNAEDVRQIVANARMSQPVKKQVWILDEVHNLSKQAFDALLIPIEDDKMNSLFIFCSTAVNKIPDTIISRIQSRKFNLVNQEKMLGLLEKISVKENLNPAQEDYYTAIRQGQGSVRATLSAFEGILGNDGEIIPSYSEELLVSLSEKNIPKLFELVAKSYDANISGREIIEQLHSDLRNLLLYVSDVDPSLVGILSVENPRPVVKGLVGVRGIIISIQEIGEAIHKMSFGDDIRIQTEIALVNIVTKLKKLEKAVLARKQQS